jgi:hypothetical protein
MPTRKIHVLCKKQEEQEQRIVSYVTVLQNKKHKASQKQGK